MSTTIAVYWRRTEDFYTESHAYGAAQGFFHASVLSTGVIGDDLLTVVEVPDAHLDHVENELEADDRVVSYRVRA